MTEQDINVLNKKAQVIASLSLPFIRWHLGCHWCSEMLLVIIRSLYECVCMRVNAHVTSEEGRAQLCRSRGHSFAGKEMRILRTLGSYDFKLQPFPDERLDSNPVCSTGVNSYPSTSNIQRMAPVFC